jgi:hypothetical protein
VARDANLKAKVVVEGADKAADQLEEIADAGEKLEKPVKVEVDADVRSVLTQLEDVTMEAHATAAAAEELGRALGPELAGKANLTGLVGDLKSMGVTVEQVTANADEMAARLKEAADADVGGKLGQSLGTARGQTEALNEAIGKGQSVAANAYGNMAQDLGSIAGLSGTAGVALGQMGEYIADAAFSSGNLKAAMTGVISTAGPLAAVTIGMQILQSAMENIKADKAFNAKVVDEFAEAIRRGSDAATQLREQMVESGKLEFSVAKQGLLQFGTEARNIVKDLDALGISYEEFLRLAESGQRLDMGSHQNEFDGTGRSINRVNDALGDFTNQQNDAEAAAEALASALGYQSVDAMQAAEGWKAFNNELDNAPTDMPATFALVSDAVERMQAGLEPTAAQLSAISTLTSKYGTTAEEVYGLVVEKQEEAADAAGETAEAQAELADAVGEAGLAMLDASRDSEAFASALERINAGSELDFSLMALDTVESFDSMKTAMEGAQKAGTDWSNVDLSPDSVDELKGISDELAAVTGSVSEMRGTIQTELQAAFDTGGIEAYTAKAEFFRGQVLDQFPQSFRDAGAGAADATRLTNDLVGELGLLPEDVEVMIRLTREEEARNALEAFSSVIAGMPTAVQVAINTMIAEGDIEGALTTLNDQLINRGYDPIVLPVDAEPSAAEDTVAGFVDDTEGTKPVIPLGADDKDAAGEVAGFKRTAEGTNPVVPVSSDVKRAVDTMIGLKILAAVLAPVVHIMGDPSNALAALRMVAGQHPQVPVTAYLRDYPSAGEIAARIGTVRVPIDAYIRTMPRIDGAG